MKSPQHPRFPFGLYIAAFSLVALLAVASIAFEIPIRQLVADPAQYFQGPFYTGFLSNLTVLTWAVGAYCAFFTRWTIGQIKSVPEWRRFFGLAGLLSIILMLDDLYMFHEEIFPNYLFFPEVSGIRPNEKFVIFGYGLFTLWFLYTSRKTIIKTPWPQLLVAGCFLAFSVLADRGIGKHLIPSSSGRVYAEDSAKFLGVLGWSVYLVTTGKAVIKQLLQTAPASLDRSKDTI